MSKKKIKAHKGGRIVRFEARLTPQEKQRIKAILKREKLSFSDWIMKQVGKTESDET